MITKRKLDKNNKHNLVDLVLLSMNGKEETLESIVNDYSLINEYFQDINYKELIERNSSNDFHSHLNKLIELYLRTYNDDYEKNYDELYKLLPLFSMDRLIEIALNYGKKINDYQKVYDYIINAFSYIEKYYDDKDKIIDNAIHRITMITYIFQYNYINDSVDDDIVNIIKSESIYKLFNYTKKYVDNTYMIRKTMECMINCDINVSSIFKKDTQLMLIKDAFDSSSEHNQDAMMLIQDKTFLKGITFNGCEQNLIEFIYSLDKEQIEYLMQLMHVKITYDNIKDEVAFQSMMVERDRNSNGKCMHTMNYNDKLGSILNYNITFFNDLERLIFEVIVKRELKELV